MNILVIWIVSLVVIGAMLVGLGALLSKRHRYLGILIDKYDRMSLSRFQVVMWTLLIASAIAAYMISQFSAAFELPTEVWALLGISVGSTAGAVIVKETKREGGLPAIKPAANSPGWPDLFKGELASDKDYVDIGKVQMFFFTLVALIGYAMAIWAWFDRMPELSQALSQAEAALRNYGGGSDAQRQALVAAVESARLAASRFPEVSSQLVTVLGISHAGYLTVKNSNK